MILFLTTAPRAQHRYRIIIFTNRLINIHALSFSNIILFKLIGVTENSLSAEAAKVKYIYNRTITVILDIQVQLDTATLTAATLQQLR